MLKIKILTLFILFQSFNSISQDRNEKVRQLNEIVTLISINSNINNRFYYDALGFTVALVDMENHKNDFFKLSNGTFSNNLNVSYRLREFNIGDFMSFENLENQIKEKINYTNKVKTFIKEETSFLTILKSPIQNYLQKTDSLSICHSLMTKYVSKKVFKKDSRFNEARKILNLYNIYFEDCLNSTDQLYAAIENLYVTKLPINDKQIALRRALSEVHFSTNLLENWRKKLLKGEHGYDIQNAERLEKLYDLGVAKDSIFFSDTKFYSNETRNLSCNPVNKYLDFFYGPTIITEYENYTNREIFRNYQTYGKTKEDHQIAPFFKSDYCRYNDFISLYNTKIKSYNNLAKFSDPEKIKDYGEYNLVKKYLDTDLNVMLFKPELMHRFAFIDSSYASNQSAQSIAIDKETIDNALPHHLIYLLDASTSMKAKGKLEKLKENAKYIVNLQKNTDKISIVSFATVSKLILQNESCEDKESINEKINSIQAAGETRINEGAEIAIDLAANNQLHTGKTTVLLITDGFFEMNKIVQEKLKSLKEYNIGFCIVYIGDDENLKLESKFKKISKIANGRFYSTDTRNLKNILVKEASE